MDKSATIPSHAVALLDFGGIGFHCAALTLEFPATGRGELLVQMLDYHFGRLVDQRSISLADGGTLIFEEAGTAGRGVLLYALMALGMLLVG